MDDPTAEELEAERQKLLAQLGSGAPTHGVRLDLLRKLAGVEFWQALIATKQAAIEELDRRGPG